MTYYQFIQAVELKVKEAVREDISVSIHTAKKNNGVHRKGLTFAQNGINISPTIYLEEYYEQFVHGIAMEKITSEILNLYNAVRFKQPWKKESVESYANVEGKIIYRLINLKANREFLKAVPYIAYLDLAIVFCVLLEITEHGTATMMIHTEHLRMWKITKEELYRKAVENTPRLLPYEFQTMCAVIEEVTGICPAGRRDALYVLSNRIRSFGATVMLYPEKLEQIGCFLEENYYVLPSSVHEVILIPESEASGQDYLKELVTEINATQVDPEDVLSDNAYYYDREEKALFV